MHKCDIKYEGLLQNCISKLNISSVQFFSKNKAKTKLAMLAFLYGGTFVNNTAGVQ